MAKTTDITGCRYGRLTAVRATDNRKGECVVWECKCDCGVITLVPLNRLTGGNTKSCGCIRREQGVTKLSKGNERYCKENTDLRKLGSAARKDNTTGRRGVYWNSRKQKWEARICCAKKNYHLGYFDDFDKAVQAREEAEEKYFHPILEKYGADDTALESAD